MSQALSSRMLGLGLLAVVAAALAAATVSPSARAQDAIEVTEVEMRIVIDDSDATVPPDPDGRRELDVDVVLRIHLSDEVEDDDFTNVAATGLRVRSSGSVEVTNREGTPDADMPECALADAEDPLVWDCLVGAYDANLFGVREGEYTLSVTNTAYSLTITDVTGDLLTGEALSAATAKLTVADINEVESVTLELAEGEPSTRAAGGSEGIELVLKILNENNAAADPGAISTILVSGPPLTLETTAGGASCDGSICQWTSRSVSQLGGRGAESIAIKATSSAPASAEVTVRVVTTADGESHEAKSPRLTFSGAADKLTVGAASGALLNEEDAGERGTIRFEVSAVDASGNAAETPSTLALSIRNPDGRTVPSSAIAREQLEPDSTGRIFVELETLAASGSPLATGEYTLRASGRGASGEQTFRVAGKAAAVTVSASEPSWSQGAAQIVLTADVTDADGQSVADGTTVRFGTNAIGTVGAGGAQLVASGGESPKTSAGRASVQYLVVANGRALVRATADGVTGTQIINIPATPGGGGGASTTDASVGLSGLATLEINGYVSWISSASTRASDLFDAGIADRGVDAIFKFNSTTKRYGAYGESSGRPLPGAVDFTINLGDILWLSG